MPCAVYAAVEVEGGRRLERPPLLCTRMREQLGVHAPAQQPLWCGEADAISNSIGHGGSYSG